MVTDCHHEEIQQLANPKECYYIFSYSPWPFKFNDSTLEMINSISRRTFDSVQHLCYFGCAEGGTANQKEFQAKDQNHMASRNHHTFPITQQYPFFRNAS